MAIVPDVPPPPLNPVSTPDSTGHRWPCRVYPGDLAELSRMRRELHRDLGELPDLSAGTVEEIVLCGSELFANGVDHSRSGEPDGHLIRTLTIPGSGLLRLGITDDGYRTTAPTVPAEPSGPAVPADRSVEEWQEAERGRGLLLVEHLSYR